MADSFVGAAIFWHRLAQDTEIHSWALAEAKISTASWLSLPRGISHVCHGGRVRLVEGQDS